MTGWRSGRSGGWMLAVLAAVVGSIAVWFIPPATVRATGTPPPVSCGPRSGVETVAAPVGSGPSAVDGRTRAPSGISAGDGETSAASATRASAPDAVVPPGPRGWERFDFFTNQGRYMARAHCMTNEAGTSDWPWIITLIGLSVIVLVGYVRIYLFWLRSYLAEPTEYRNRKLMDLANIFAWCGVCGYGLSAVMFFWPAYRLLAICLAVLAFFTWRFIGNLSDLRVSFSAKRIEAEYAESLRTQNERLEREVAERTRDAEAAREEAEAANQAKSDFVAFVSHELRSPSVAIAGYAELLDELDGDDEITSAETHAVIRRNAEHLLAMVDDLLDLGKVEAGRLDVETMAVVVPDVVRDVVQWVKPRADDGGVAIDLVGLEAFDGPIATDPTRLRQILLNLLSNAVKFSAGGAVTVRCRLETADRGGGSDQRADEADGADEAGGPSDPSRSTAIFDIVDTGEGLSADQCERIFEPYRQADVTTSRRHGGTGLGLPISRRLARLLGGDLTVTSTPGAGSTFTLRIAAAPADGEAAPAEQAPRSPGARPRGTEGRSDQVVPPAA